MKTLTVALSLIALVLGTAARADANATTTNVSLAGQDSVEPGSPTCAGGTATNTFTFKTGHFHETVRPDGTRHARIPRRTCLSKTSVRCSG